MSITIERAGKNIDVKNHFFYGELSRSFWGRISTNVYNSSAKEISNFIIYPSGGIRKRLGTQYLFSSTTEDLFTVNGNDVDVIFKRDQTTNVIDYAIYKDGVLTQGWTTTTLIPWDELQKINVISPDGEEIFFTVKSGIFTLNKTTGALAKKQLDYVAGTGTTEPVDFSHVAIFDNSMLIFENEKISTSAIGDLYNFNFSNPGINSAYQQTNNLLKNVGAEITNIITYKDTLIITTTAGIFGLAKLQVSDTIRLWKIYFIGTQIVPPKCIINQNSHLFFTTNSGLWTFATNINVGANFDLRAGVDNFETVLLSSYSGHVFDVPIIQLSKRKRDYPTIIYGLREDGIIINFTIHPRQLTETNISTISVSRRTCEGKYLRMTLGFFSACVTKRIDRNGNTAQFAEKEIFNSFINDNRIQRRIEDNFLMKNRSYFDCCRINDGFLDDKGVLSDLKNKILIKFPKKTYAVGEKIEVDSQVVGEITAVNQSGDILTLTFSKPLLLPNKNDGDLVFLDGKLQDKIDESFFNKIKNYDFSGYSYVILGQIYVHDVKSKNEVNTTTNKGIHTVCGIGFKSFVRIMPSSSYFEKTMPLSANVVTADTPWLRFGILEENTDKIFYRRTDVDFKTGLHRIDIPSFGDQQHMNYEYFISAKNGFDAVILSINFENIQQNLRDF